jgi:hypothetical protein
MSEENLATENQRLREALEATALRLEDLAEIIERDGPYNNAGFLRASAVRCRRTLSGGQYGDTVAGLVREIVRAELEGRGQ